VKGGERRACFWDKAGKKNHLGAIVKSASDSKLIKSLLKPALIDRINKREVFVKGVDYSYWHEKGNDITDAGKAWRRDKRMAQHYVYRFYAELYDYEPKIWRRFEINGEKTMAELGYAVMLMFEMQASHLFCFREDRASALLARLREQYTDAEIKGVWERYLMSDLAKSYRYELKFSDTFIDKNDDERLIKADEIKLRDVTRVPDWNLIMEYDYGDGWEVALTLEDCEKREVSLAGLPHLIEGEGYGIIEDVGGTYGLEKLAKALKKRKGREYNEFVEWLDSTTLDLEAFDVDDMNFRLKKLVRVYKEIYEYHYEPSARMLDILQRAYLGKGMRGY
jgi:hypothetical protein